jgi:hypothetical protein
MKRIRLLVPVIAFGLALLPSSAFASTLYTESVIGVETGQPTACPASALDSLSSFAGYARGTLNGVFQIAVCHAPLSASGAKIDGGTFAISNGTKTIAGAFTSGEVFPPSLYVTGSLCIQKYVVSGALSSGKFAGTLVHYGFWTGSSCSVFFATISGKATLTA